MKDSPDDLLDLVHTVMHEYRSLQYRFLRDGPHDISHMDGKVLAFFAAHPGATQSDLVVHSGRDKAQLGRLIKGLRERGLLRAESDVTDRRSVRLSLTATGKQVHVALQRQAKRLSAKAVAGLDAEEQEHLARLLRTVKSNLSAPDA
ncbi:MarR family winged helix-turn-helix transcriptional regulator [Paraburkholderia pallida]|uniref:MarR family transcriptional regulator n=1 Tax=Paraburkholderia pallida TaxID=2547399 RepID=A0A4P7DBG2_9BURK|nr:MarR family transcriptional regulator [Paraburkholderia pallida]QBR04142.1 MarR family transcriptional regulator [Paraburkholderia pallida]